jgi:cyclic pyranopterin phosphate synthase
MVDVGGKPATRRLAIARARVRLPPVCAAALASGAANPKGDVAAVARLAGIMAAKRTAELIPLCHPLPLDRVEVEVALAAPAAGAAGAVEITATVATTGRTGVEMEALTAASVAALTVYDMLKGLSHELVIEGIELIRKEGGRSGVIDRAPAPATMPP